MAKSDDRPTLSEMRDWRDQLNGEWSGSSYPESGSLDEQQDQEERLYFQRFDVESPQGKMTVRTGSAPADCDAAIDTLVPLDILVRVRPARAQDKYRKQADKLVRLGRALLFSWRRKHDVLRDLVSDMVIRRVGVGRVLVDDRMWPPAPAGLPEEERDDWEVANRRRCPVVFERRNPRYVRWRDNNGDLLAVVEHYQATAMETRLAYGQYDAAAKVLRGREPNDKVLVSDVWVGAYRCVMIEDEPIFPGSGKYKGVLPHGYLEIPYVMSGFRELPFEEPDRRYRGLLSNAAGLYPIESQVLTMHIWMLAWNAWRSYKTWTADGRDIEIVPGSTIPLDPRKGEYLDLLEGQPVPPELLQTAGVMDSYIQRNSTAQGPRSTEGTRSGQQVWAIQAMRQAKIESARQALVMLINRSLELGAMHVETVLKEPLTLPVPGRDREGEDYGEVRVTPKDINGYWSGYDVSFTKRLDPAVLEQAKALSALSQNNWMPMRVSWEMSGLTDVPQEWADELVIQTVDRHPAVLEATVLERIKNWYGGDSAEYKALAAKILQPGPPGRGMPAAMPGAPGVPSGGSMQPPAMKDLGGVGADMAGGMQPKSSARPTGRNLGPRRPPGVSGPSGF